MNVVIFLIFLLPFGLAVALIVRGVRGFRVGDHPVCRRCGFDLFGQPAGTVVCGECGHSLMLPGSVVIGNRRRRPSFVVAGVIIGVPILLAAGFFTWGSVNKVNWLDYAPVSWLQRWAMSVVGTTRAPALAELNARLVAGKLSRQQCSALIDAGLIYQGDLSKPWDTGWGDFLETAQAKGQLSPQQWTQYVSQTTLGVIGVRLRPRVRLGDPLFGLADRSTGRVAANSRLMAEMSDWHVVWPGAAKVMAMSHCSSTGPVNGGKFSVGFSCPASEFTPGIKPGRVTVHVVGSIISGPPGASAWRPLPVATREFDFPASFNLLAADQPSLALVHDPTLVDAIKRSIGIQFFRLRSRDGMLNLYGAPVGLSFNVIFKDGSYECPVGSFACPAGTANQGYGLSSGVGATTGKTVDVILRSNPAAALATTDVFQMWDGEILIKDVPVN